MNKYMIDIPQPFSCFPFSIWSDKIIVVRRTYSAFVITCHCKGCDFSKFLHTQKKCYQGILNIKWKSDEMWWGHVELFKDTGSTVTQDIACILGENEKNTVKTLHNNYVDCLNNINKENRRFAFFEKENCFFLVNTFSGMSIFLNI